MLGLYNPSVETPAGRLQIQAGKEPLEKIKNRAAEPDAPPVALLFPGSDKTHPHAGQRQHGEHGQGIGSRDRCRGW